MIKKEDIIGEVIEKHPEAGKVMMDFGLHCIGCRVSPYESIENGCKVHGFDDEKIGKMVDEINKAIEDKPEDKPDSDETVSE